MSKLDKVWLPKDRKDTTIDIGYGCDNNMTKLMAVLIAIVVFVSVGGMGLAIGLGLGRLKCPTPTAVMGCEEILNQIQTGEVYLKLDCEEVVEDE